MEFYELIAQGIYAFLDFIAIEIILISIFTIDDDDNIKYTFGRLFGDTKYKKTSLFIYCIILIVPAYFFISNYIQDTIVNYLITTGWKTIPSFTAVVSFSVLWFTKVNIGRRWDFELVWASLVVFIISSIIILLF